MRPFDRADKLLPSGSLGRVVLGDVCLGWSATVSGEYSLLLLILSNPVQEGSFDQPTLCARR